jgi:PAS domain S-box-containing protein
VEKRYTVLVVDDEPAHLELIRRAFESAGTGAVVKTAGTMREYGELSASGPVDIALIDLKLPDGSALNALISPPEDGPFPILIMTAHGDEKKAVAAMKAGALEFIVKSPEAFAGIPLAAERCLKHWGLLQQRKRAKKEARTYLELVSTIIVAIGADAKVSMINPEGCRLLGMREEEVVGKDWFENFLPERIRADVRRAFTQLMAGGPEGPRGFENLVATKNGDERVILWNNTILKDPAGRITGTLSSGQDITERKRAEEARRESESRFQSLVEQSPEAIFVQAEGRFLYLNPAACGIFRAARPEDLIGQGFMERIAPEYHAAIQDRIRLQRETGKPAPLMEQEYLRLDGSRVPVETTAVHVQFQGQDAHLVFVHDLTERKRNEEKIDHLNLVLRAIRNVAQLIIHQKDPRKLITEAAKLLVEQRGYTHAMIILTDAAGQPREHAAAGFGGEFEAVAEGLRRGVLPPCCAEAAAHQRFFRIEDHARTCGSCPAAAACSRGPSLCLPLRSKDALLGCMSVGFDPGVEVTAEEQSLFIEVGGDLAFALSSIAQAQAVQRTEASLRESETRYRAFFEQARDSILVLELLPDGLPIIRDANDAALRMRGYSREELIGQPITFLDAEVPNATWADERRRKLESADGSTFLMHHRRKDGTIFPAEASVIAMDIGGKRFAIDITRDMTERKKAEEALRSSEEEFRRLAESMPQIVWVTRPDGWNIFFNQQWMDYTGLTIEESMGHGWNKPFHPDDRQRAWDAWKKATAEVCEYALECRLRRADGAYRWWLVRGAPVKDAAGVIVKWYGTCTDIHDLKMAEIERENMRAQLRQSQRMEVVGRLAGGVAHDFNNLLTAILGNCTFLLADIPQDDPRRADVEEIRKAGERAANLTRQLLAFSRKQVLQPRVLDMNSVLTDMEKLLRRLIGEDIELRISRAEGLAPVKADPGQMEQIVMNLAVNARDAMRKGGRLSIATGNLDLPKPRSLAHDAQVPPGRYMLMKVSDTGEGMDAQVLEHIFEPFFTTKETGKGTGLGLATVYGIVKQSGGFIDVRSEPGQGAAFSIFLPAASGAGPEGGQAEEGEVVEKKKRRGQKGSGTILLVEDDEVVRRIALRILAEAGYIVIEAKSGQEALAHLDEHFDLVLTDIVLADIPGVEVAARLKSARPSVRVVFTSGYADNPDIRDILAKPENRFLQKPFTAQALRDMVSEALG